MKLVEQVKMKLVKGHNNIEEIRLLYVGAASDGLY